jgi:hypothetical protein
MVVDGECAPVGEQISEVALSLKDQGKQGWVEGEKCQRKKPQGIRYLKSRVETQKR